MRTWELMAHGRPSAPEVLDTSGRARAIAIDLPAGTALEDHEVHETAWVVVASGRVTFSADGRRVEGGPGLLARFDPRERHEVRAVDDAKLLLLLTEYPAPDRMA
jgi:quercetin dioxygenase-like cupin family protein